MFHKKGLLLIVVVVFCLISGYFIIDCTVEKKILSNEIDKIYKVDITSSAYDYDIKTFLYSSIEKDVKSYIKGQNKEYLKVSKLMNSKEIKSVLSYDNYKRDGDQFMKSIKLIEDTKKSINKKLDRLINNSTTNDLIQFVQGNHFSNHYNKLCDEVLNTDKMIHYLNHNRELFVHSKEEFNHILDVELDVVTFLKNNKGNWELHNGEIQFRTDALFDKYNSFISKIK